ncbi:MAG: amidase, partial [Solirubrobacteraceae bacterium]|nr:amidase [Solirubrobacteraceae bacterium]
RVHGDPATPALGVAPVPATDLPRVTAAAAQSALQSQRPRSLTEQSATELARMIRSHEVTAREVLEAHIARLRLTEPRVNAVVAYRYAAAREAADAADARIAAAGRDEILPPLLGVPCTIKESIGVAGMPNTAGFMPVAGRLAEVDAPAVQRLVEAGAIPLGVTNTSELCLWIEARNRVYGDTANPYDVTRTVGGSSGGEGAVIGSGGSPFGLGSDLAGSIRVPAFCCGIFGHKPSVGVVPTTGHFPMGAGPSRRMMVIGPLARRAEDLMPLMRILNYDDPSDPYDREIPLGDPADVQLDGLRVVVPDGLGVTSLISKEMLGARERAIAHLASQGANVERVSARGLIKTQIVFIEALRAALDDDFNDSIGWEVERIRDMYRDLRGTEGTHTPAFVNLMSAARLFAYVRRARSTEPLELAASKLAASFTEQIGDGVMVLPPLPRAAPPHGWTTLRP